MNDYVITHNEQIRLNEIIAGRVPKDVTVAESAFYQGYECALLEMTTVQGITSIVGFNTFDTKELFMFLTGFGVGQDVVKEQTGRVFAC